MVFVERPLLGRLYFALFLRKIGLEEFAEAQKFLGEAIKLFPRLAERPEMLSRLIAVCAFTQSFAPPLTFTQSVLDNLPNSFTGQTQLRRRVLGKIHIGHAFGEFTAGHGTKTRYHIFRGLRLDSSYLKNRGVMAVFARSFLYKQTSDPEPIQDYGNPMESVPKFIISEVEAALGCPVDSLEDISGTYSGDKIYLIKTGGKLYILRLLTQSDIEKRIAVVELVRAVDVPTPAILASCLREGGNVSAWMLEEWMPGSQFVPSTMSLAAELAIAADLGRYLRRLHTIHLKEFGRISSAQLKTPYQTFAAWLDSRQQNIVKACFMGLIPEATLPVLDAADHFLRESFAGTSVLCHGDLGKGNILVDAGRVTAIIDWEDVGGCDPAYDIAVLFTGLSQSWYPVKESEMLAAVLKAYDPDMPDEFSRRIIAHRLLFTAAAIVHMNKDKNEYFDVYRSILADACIGGVFLY